MSDPMRLRELLLSRRPGFTLPRPFYQDPDIYLADMEAIFHRQWLFVAATCEIREPGQYVTVSIGDTPIIVLRGRDGEIRAWFNTCRHRGSKILEAPRGQASAVICPYHQWTYRLTGELAHARHMPDDFDRTQFGLRPVHVRTVAGTIYVCLADDPPDFAPYAAAMEAQLAPHHLERAKLALEVDLVEQGNWKLVMENSRECYHCATEHRELMRTFLDIYDFADPQASLPIREHWARWREAGLPWEIAEGPDHRATQLPLMHGAQSITSDGKLACGKQLGLAPPDTYGSLRWVHYPSTFNHALRDYAVLIRMLPLGPQQTLVTTKFLVAEDAVEGEDYDLAHLTHVWNVTNDEDRRLVERNQLGVNSAGYRPGPYSPALEAGIIKFADWYCARMRDYLGVSAASERARAG